MKKLLGDLGIEVTKDNKSAIDKKLHYWLSVDYPNCAATWKMVRKRLKEDGDGFRDRLREVLAEFIPEE
ncbi:MAG: hypothetical protein GF411_07515 [Candidatus Lokiarchaeota archaeon]|nr:hypothetical protein [Candidatus Lokiarchaeota archaeon]